MYRKLVIPIEKKYGTNMCAAVFTHNFFRLDTYKHNIIHVLLLFGMSIEI